MSDPSCLDVSPGARRAHQSSKSGRIFLLPKARKEQKAEQVELLTEKLKKAKVADLPSRDVLLAQLLGTLQSPVAQLVGIMQTPVQQLIGLLNAYKTKLEAA